MHTTTSCGPDRIKLLRAALGFSQERLAHELGVALAQVGRWERGLNSPTRRDVLARLDALALSAGIGPLATSPADKPGAAPSSQADAHGNNAAEASSACQTPQITSAADPVQHAKPGVKV